MDELKQMIDQIDDNAELDGAKLKEILYSFIDVCEFEIEHLKKRHKLALLIKTRSTPYLIT